MIDAKGRFIIDNYGRKPAFASFLPGISGISGIPLWCYYVNRGQCISCFGSEDKDHSIMEFVPAHQAYLHTGRMGYRTFLKVNGAFYEAFADTDRQQTMCIDQNVLRIEEKARDKGIVTRVTYYTLPEEKLGALVRKVELQNITNQPVEVEYLDGAPAIVPYGVNQDSMKNMTQTAKAWMQVEDVCAGRPYFRVRASMADSTQVVAIEGGNFSIAIGHDGSRLSPVVDAEAVFAYDTAYEHPHIFLEKGIDGVLSSGQMTMNRIPCCFYGEKVVIEPGESCVFYEMTGQVARKELLDEYLQKKPDAAYFESKLVRAEELTRQITECMDTRTANPAFDAYCRQDFLDNVLRGGMPIHLGEKEIFYVYARKHGDMERDYNYFRLLPEFYSQGNGNFRDINQNRRCDVAFFPQVGDKNIHMFYDFIQLDGYNPLGVEKTTYSLPEERVGEAAQILGIHEEEAKQLTHPYTPGMAASLLESRGDYGEKELTEMIGSIVDMSESLVTSDFLEGYWCDHWTYNLDLIENYCSIYPEREHQLLYEDGSYVYMKPGAGVYPRKQRYVETEEGIRQYHAVYPIKYKGNEGKRLTDTKGRILHTTLLEKLILLNTLKFATLDPYGCGIEMEGGKPGWYDALNGLPGLMGSSMAETCELARNLEYTIDILRKYQQGTDILRELYEFIKAAYEIINMQKAEAGEAYFPVWNRINDIKEAYRDKIYAGVEGTYVNCTAQELLTVMEAFYRIVMEGIAHAVTLGDGLIPTYFTYEITEYVKEEDGIRAVAFRQHVLPHFLEGPVRYLKLRLPAETKREVYEKVRSSQLYDSELSMYKVNEPLEKESYELGRCRAFTPGWLENESIWLHMEYKYLLELLKSGLYQQYIGNLYKAAIPFQDEERYGRSILENSSFLASSANPDESIHGRGFVARLSGSTVEFMDMWQRMMFGHTPFREEDDKLVFALQPVIPSYLLDQERRVEAVFLGKVRIVYHVDVEDADYIPENYEVVQYCLTGEKDKEIHIYQNQIMGEEAENIRAGKYTQIEVWIKK